VVHAGICLDGAMMQRAPNGTGADLLADDRVRQAYLGVEAGR